MLEILNETPQSLPLDILEDVLATLFQELGVGQTVTLIFCTDAFIHNLNLRDREVDGPTDVLSYPLHEPGDATMPKVEQLGDIFISLDTASRQAETHGFTLTEEILTLAAHGIRHLQGFDHPTEEAWQTFHTTQKRARELYHEKY